MSAYAIPTIETWYSLLRSTIEPQALLDLAQQRKIAAIGICDQATTLAHVPVALAARDTGVHVAFGAAVTMEDGYPLRIIARDDDGYRNLTKLVSVHAKGVARLPWDLLKRHQRGLYLLCGGRSSRLWQALKDGDERLILHLARLQALGERDDRFAVEVQQYPSDGANDVRMLRELLDRCSEAGVRVIATHDVQVLHADEASKHRLIHAIDHQLPFWCDDLRLPIWRKHQPSAYALPDVAEWHRKWEGLEHLSAGSAALLLDCDVTLLGRRRFPGASLAPSKIYDDLWARAFNGLRQRYGQLRPDLMKRLSYEVDEVMNQGVGPFLIYAAELVERAAKRGIRMILQGSGTGSLLCYALGISPVDPFTSEAGALVFERFAGSHRGAGDLPDLDFGVPAGREDEVRDILRDMFGAPRVAFLAAVTTLRERGAIRTAATAFGWDSQQIHLLRLKLKTNEPLDRNEEMIVSAGRQIEGQPSHLMRHASGVIVADEPLDSLYGVGSCADGPLLLANKDDVEVLQLLKFDILNWYVSAIFDQAERTIQASIYPKPDLWHVSGEDTLTGDLLEAADTRCIPYLQSPASMTLLRALRTRSEADIALCVGALRPGASHTRDRLMAAIHGGTATLPGWDTLTEAHKAVITATLQPSRGALIFDEDLLRVANVLGLSFADAERLRKALKKGQHDGPMTNKLRAAALTNGWADREIDTVLHWFIYIRRYTFTRGHAIAMAFVAWRTARLSAHYPTHFYAAVFDWLGLGTGGGMYPILVYIVEAKRHGLGVRGPHVNGPWQSQPGEQAVQCGLKMLRSSINVATLERIHAAAQQHPFTTITDLCHRVELTGNELEKLIAAGTLDLLAESRRHARWEAQYAHTQRPEQSTLLDEQSWRRPMALELEDQEERAHEEYAVLGFTLSIDHPIMLCHDLAGHRIVCAGELQSFVGQQVEMAGIIVAGRRIHTKADRLMAFASLCDRSGTAELTLFEDVAERYAEMLEGMVLVSGTVTDDRERGVGLDVKTVRQL